MSEALQIVQTDDGSSTVFVPFLNEHYHSRYGALAESLHIFIHEGFNSLGKRQVVSVFEVGFGTGLNALLTCMEAERQSIQVIYHTVEKYPLDKEIIRKLNYPDMICETGLTEHVFSGIHQAAWGRTVPITPRFTLLKVKADFAVFQPDYHYDLVYFDAFAPEKQPEMWRPEHFTRIYKKMNYKGVLVTYCVKGQVKRDLREAGFIVEVLPGPPGKRHMTRARKPSE